MSVYAELLDIARRQTLLAQSGDVEAAIALIDERESLLSGASPATDAEAAMVREVISLDKTLAGAIRERMIALRDQAAGLQHRRTALVGYRPPLGERVWRRLDAVS